MSYLKATNHQLKAGKGYTLIEVLVYSAVLAVVVVLVVGSTIRLGSAFAKARNNRRLNAVGTVAMERIIREIRRASSIDPAPSGTLKMQVPQTFGELVAADGAVSHWNFEETSGGTLVDQIGGNNGTLMNDPTQGVPAVVGKGYSFDGDDDMVEIFSSDFGDDEQGAVEVIVKPDLSASVLFVPIFAQNNPSTIDTVKQAIFLGIQESKDLILVAKRRYGFLDQDLWFEGNTVLNPSFYYHIVMEVDNTGTRLYVNGSEDQPYLYGASIAPTDNNDTQWFADFPDLDRYNIGAFVDPSSWPNPGTFTAFKGTIDEIAVYDKPLGEAAWNAHYKAAFQPDDTAAGTTTKMYLDSGLGQVFYQKGSAAAEALTPDNVSITALEFTPLNNGGTTKGVRIKLTATAGTESATFYGTAVTR